MNPRLTHLLLAAALLLGLAAAAGAETLETSFTIWPTVNDWRRDVTVDQFNPDYGQLNSVAISISGTYDGAFYNENLSAQPSTWSDSYHFEMLVSLLDQPLISFDADYAAQGELNEFDGAADFSGPSGDIHPFLLPISGSTIRQGDLSQFIGTTLLHLIVDSGASSVLSQSRTGTQVAASRGAVTITFIYNYTPSAVSAETATWSQVKQLYR
ncbi:MAG TPA: choice-of-anchor E domain-containing protein [Candidatus Krumholzibacteria bacterium]|nr:choice-of-anchor E domain-containing protein [Candidatus Krumholzibacteria bacterium]HRX52645.1 choice-of-anchor E domain-containing protein [Candidatus Krumholzibacteria bacterium]